MEFYTEAGLAYFTEDYDRLVGPYGIDRVNGKNIDDSYISGRWAMRLDWPVSPDRVTIFHYHEGFPGLEDAKDLYIMTEQGVRLTVIENFVATVQVNWRWDNTPSAGFRRADTLYLFTLGYAAEL